VHVQRRDSFSDTNNDMYHRVPTTKDGKPIETTLSALNKPFKTPTAAKLVDRAQVQRKRKRVSYKENKDGSDTDDDDDPRKKQKKRQKAKADKDRTYGQDENGEPINVHRLYPLNSAVKPFHEVSAKRFSIPAITTSTGETINHALSMPALGIRPLANVIPRPLHDPMADHAIILFDPTIDVRETDEERKEREREEEKRKRTEGVDNSVHGKSLKELLGGGATKKTTAKMPVVIDPMLTKVLRPHQVEGVKVCLCFFGSLVSSNVVLQFLYKCTTGMIVENQYGYRHLRLLYSLTISSYRFQMHYG
jgi:DNA repair and recombination RAD54-like protein